MASVYRKQRRWWIRYKDVAGRWKDIPTTKADTKVLAKLLAHDLEHKIERQRLGLDPILTVKGRHLRQGHGRVVGRAPEPAPLEDDSALRRQAPPPCPRRSRVGRHHQRQAGAAFQRQAGRAVAAVDQPPALLRPATSSTTPAGGRCGRAQTRPAW